MKIKRLVIALKDQDFLIDPTKLVIQLKGNRERLESISAIQIKNDGSQTLFQGDYIEGRVIDKEGKTSSYHTLSRDSLFPHSNHLITHLLKLKKFQESQAKFIEAYEKMLDEWKDIDNVMVNHDIGTIFWEEIEEEDQEEEDGQYELFQEEEDGSPVAPVVDITRGISATAASPTVYVDPAVYEAISDKVTYIGNFPKERAKILYALILGEAIGIPFCTAANYDSVLEEAVGITDLDREGELITAEHLLVTFEGQLYLFTQYDELALYHFFILPFLESKEELSLTNEQHFQNKIELVYYLTHESAFKNGIVPMMSLYGFFDKERVAGFVAREHAIGEEDGLTALIGVYDLNLYQDFTYPGFLEIEDEYTFEVAPSSLLPAPADLAEFEDLEEEEPVTMGIIINGEKVAIGEPVVYQQKNGVWKKRKLTEKDLDRDINSFMTVEEYERQQYIAELPVEVPDEVLGEEPT